MDLLSVSAAPSVLPGKLFTESGCGFSGGVSSVVVGAASFLSDATKLRPSPLGAFVVFVTGGFCCELVDVVGDLGEFNFVVLGANGDGIGEAIDGLFQAPT